MTQPTDRPNTISFKNVGHDKEIGMVIYKPDGSLEYEKMRNLSTDRPIRAEVEEMLERAKRVPSIPFGYIRISQYCLELMDALEKARNILVGEMLLEGETSKGALDTVKVLEAVLPESEEVKGAN